MDRTSSKRKRLYLFSYVPLGFGSPQFIYLINNILMSNKYDITVLETFRFWIPTVDVPFIRDVSRKILGAFLGRKLMALPKKTIIFRFLNLLNVKLSFSCNVIFLIFVSYFKDIVIIVTEPSIYFNFFSKKTKIIEYNLEIWEEETNSSSFSLIYRKKVNAVIFPQKNRMDLSSEKFNSACKFFLIENACEAPKYELNVSKYMKPKAIFSGRITKNNIDYISKFVSFFELNCVDTVIAGNVDTDIYSQFSRLTEEFLNLKYLGFITNEKLRNIIKECSIGLILWGNESLNTRYCAPNKLYEYLSEGLMVISIDNESMHDFNNAYKFGYVLPQNFDLSCIDLSTANVECFGRHNFNLVQTYVNYSTLCADFVNEIL